MVDDPRLSRELSLTCLDLLENGAVPPLPITVFQYGEYARALRLMTSGKHQGNWFSGRPIRPQAPTSR